MKMIKQIACLTLSFSTIIPAEQKPVTYYSIRSQGVNAARRLVGQVDFINLPDAICPYGTLSVASGYTRTFRHQHITDCLFGTQTASNNGDSSAITISGSAVSNRGSNDWLADYFYLPTDFQSTIQFKPRIDNFFVDLGFFLGLDEWYEGLYCAFYAPFTHSRWDLNLKETIINRGTQNGAHGYFTPQSFDRGNMLKSFASYAAGNNPNPVSQASNSENQTGDITVSFDSLDKARMSSKKLVKSRFAEFRGVFGFNAYNCENYHAGIALHFVAPTGNRPNADYLFEPIVGNGHHYELGGELHGHYALWHNCDETVNVSIYGDAIVTHLFGTRQQRTFDLKNRPFSRYMLALMLDTEREEPHLVGPSDAGVEFQRSYVPVANLTTLQVNASVGVQADLVAMVHIDYCNASFDFGYNLWARSCEKLSVRLSPLDNNAIWALKGDSFVYGFSSTGTAVALAPTQDNATIHSGINAIKAVPSMPTDAADTNIGVDNPVIAQTNEGSGDVFTRAGGMIPIRTSNPVILLQTGDIDVDGRSTSGLSSKLFAHFNYTFDECEGWIPYLGFGGEIEIDHSQHLQSKECIRCAISQWGIWFKGGIAFD